VVLPTPGLPMIRKQVGLDLSSLCSTLNSEAVWEKRFVLIALLKAPKYNLLCVNII